MFFGGTFVARYVAGGLRLSEISHPAIFGLLLVIIGFQTFCFTLLIEMVRRLSFSNRSATPVANHA